MNVEEVVSFPICDFYVNVYIKLLQLSSSSIYFITQFYWRICTDDGVVHIRSKQILKN